MKQEELNLTEIALIKALDCSAPDNRGYNIHPGGRGGPHAKETRKKMSDAHKGKIITASHKLAISVSKKGKVRTTFTKEHKKAIGSSKEGKARSDETRARISAGLKKALRSPEARAASSARMKGKVRSPEARAAISARMKAYKRAVIITLLVVNAATEMGVKRQSMGSLVNKKSKKSTSKGGDCAGQLSRRGSATNKSAHE